jgi:cell division protein FtsN
VQPKIQKPAHAGPYHIISGSFLVLENAEKQQTTLRAKGLNAELLPRRGKYYMVSLGSYATQEEAATTVEKLRLQLHQDFWVMKISKR